MHDFFDLPLEGTHAFDASHQHDSVHHDDTHLTPAGHEHHQPGLIDIAHALHLTPFEHALDLMRHGHFLPSDLEAMVTSMGPIGHILEILQPPQAYDGQQYGDVQPYAHFYPTGDEQYITGNPGADMAAWHYQVNPDTCAIVSQEFIIESLTGRHIDEETLKHEAERHGWYTPGGGTPMEHVGDLLEEFGLHVQREQGASLADIASKLDHHQKIIVGINAEEIWYHGGPNDPLAAYPGIPGLQADHAVEVIGINNTDEAHPLIILNDPGNPEGRGIEIPADVFAQAWASSGNYMISTTDMAQQPLTQNSMLAGYSNADGTYHYDSDNTDRDPQTGTIIRQW